MSQLPTGNGAHRCSSLLLLPNDAQTGQQVRASFSKEVPKRLTPSVRGQLAYRALGFSAAVIVFTGVLFAVAEMEQETRRERQRAGIEAAKERGVYQGRKPGTNNGDGFRGWSPSYLRRTRGRSRHGEDVLDVGAS